MKFLRNLFGNSKPSFQNANRLVRRLKGVKKTYQDIQSKETALNKGTSQDSYKQEIFAGIDELGSEICNHMHLIEMLGLATDSLHPDQIIERFLEKRNRIIYVFGKILEVGSFSINGGEYTSFITLLDEDLSTNPPRIVTVNIHVLSEDQLQKLKSLKKDDFFKAKIRIPENTTVNGFGKSMVSRVNSLLTYHKTSNQIIPIYTSKKFRYDIKGVMLEFQD